MGSGVGERIFGLFSVIGGIWSISHSIKLFKRFKNEEMMNNIPTDEVGKVFAWRMLLLGPVLIIGGIYLIFH